MFRWNSVTERTFLRSIIWGTSIVLKAYNYMPPWKLWFCEANGQKLRTVRTGNPIRSSTACQLHDHGVRARKFRRPI